MSYSWFRQGTCTVSASDVVRFQGANITTAPNKPVVGDAFTVGGFRFYEIIFIGSDATGEYVRLNRAYEEAAGSNISYAVARFASGTQNAKLVAMASAAINQKQISLDDMYEWYTSQEDTVQFLGPDGTFTTITTYYKLSQEITAVGGSSAAITVVANNINDVKTVATNIAAVNLVAPSIPAINAANDNMPAITAVNSEIQSVITVSENIPLLNAITPSIPAINNVNNNIATIAAVNADMVSVKNVSDNMADVKDAKPQADRAKDEADRAMLAADSIFAMSQAQFEAIRAQNKERYTASGWVSFGNHESGKQVNEFKPGLYTELTTSNTLLIGKAGGVGGSKTDYASVHIDGVVFNLTNQFVLTMPSHPTSTQPERMDMYGLESEKVEISSAAPNAYQGGLRGVGAAVNLFSATDQQKKDFFAQNSNTTYIGSDGKIYQWQLYEISFAGTTGGVPSPTEQGYSLNSFGDLWIKAGKKLLYFGNVLRLNDGGYHPTFNPFGAASFVGDTFWHNTAASITSRADCFNPAKLLAGSGSITSGKSGRPEIGGRYYDSIYADGYGGICRDMRHSAHFVNDSYKLSALVCMKNSKSRASEALLFTKVKKGIVSLSGSYDGGYYIKTTEFPNAKDAISDKRYSFVYNATKDVICYVAVVESSGNIYITRNSICRYFPNVGNELSGYKIDPYTESSVGDVVYFADTYESAMHVGGTYITTDIAGKLSNIFEESAFPDGWYGRCLEQMPSGKTVKYDLHRKAITTQTTTTWRDINVFPWFSTDNLLIPNSITNMLTGSSFPSSAIAVNHYLAKAKITNHFNNSALQDVFNCTVEYISDYKIENCALLGESLIGKVLKSNLGILVGNNKTTSATIDSTGKLTSSTGFEGVTHGEIMLSLTTNYNPALKFISFISKVDNMLYFQFCAVELKHNGSVWLDNGKIPIIDGESTIQNANLDFSKLVMHISKEPIGWA